MLRVWQAECADLAVRKYQSGLTHFFCQATPGAGKTTLAAEIASRLLLENMVDLVLCFSPSLTVSDSIQKTFSRRLKCSFNGALGAIGQALTYQALQYLNNDFWETLRKYRVFVVFDEIHHCSGDRMETANAWGSQILTRIQGLATFTLAMSGTPWRTDLLPIVMANYSNPEGALIVDYQYPLGRAIQDKVCRLPKIVLIDSHKLSTSQRSESIQHFSSIREYLSESKGSYQSIIHNPKAMEHILGQGCDRLASLRSESISAGGLVVAASVKHAHSIAKMLIEKFAQTVSIVSYLDDKPLKDIQQFREDQTQWIISVGMISEGTDIPRLQVCCHLSAIKTELYFRQVLGRILRVNGTDNQQAWLYTFAEPNLVAFAERIENDIPESCMYSNMSTSESVESISLYSDHEVHTNRKVDLAPPYTLDIDEFPTMHDVDLLHPSGFDELQLSEFRKRVISAFI
ncbi:DEAD/DEAH box helicase family protein [Shewanella sp. A25]|nr:DEAD/DEAH box helicase family protein [Shewanella shenzhenensis]